MNLHFTEQHTEKTIFLNPCTQQEIEEIINDLNKYSAVGPDEVSSCDVKNLKMILSPILTNLINDILVEGEFPECLKLSKVLPIHKAGPLHDPGNKRPISITATFSKIIEKVIKSRLIKFVSSTFNFDCQQYGFQKGSNTQAAVVELIEFITGALDNKKYAVAVFIDLQKAFDTVNINILLDKLEMMGFRGVAYNLIKSYLTNRRQYVEVNQKKSNICNTNIGVPQGSVLGPILYLLYVHSLKEANLGCTYITFADDTVLLFALSAIETCVNESMEIYYKWLLKNNLKINVKKTEYMVFRQKNKNFHNIVIKINNVEIKSVDVYKYLGLNIDVNLTFNHHIQCISKKLASACGVIRKLSNYLPEHMKMVVYESLFKSHVQYLSAVWAMTAKSNISKLQRQQNKVLKSINKLPRLFSTADLFKKVKTLKISDIIKLEENKLMYKVLNKLIKTKLNPKKSSDLHNYGTRTHGNLYVPRFRTNVHKNSMVIRLSKTFNELPEDYKSIKSLSLFSRKLKQHLLRGYV